MPLNIDIPEGVIRDAIAVAIAESFTGEKRDALIRDIVRAHLQYRANNYDKETLLGNKVNEIIGQMVSDQIVVTLQEMRPHVNRIVSEVLGDSFRDSLYKSLEAGLKSLAVGNLRIKVDYNG